MKKLDALLNSITMYRLVVYALVAYGAFGVGLAFAGRLPFTPTAMILSLALILGSAYGTDRLLGRLLNVPTNMETWLITGLIIFLIVHPASSVADGLALVVAGVVSSASKFVLSWNGKHIFNPAAFAAALVSLTALQPTTWWVGNSAFWPLTLLLGLAIVRKIRRFALIATFGGVTIILQLVVFIANNQPIATGMKGALIASPLIFLGTLMLTEPATMPPRRGMQMIFGALVAVLYVMAWKVGPLYIYPEVALLIGNIFAFAVSPKFRVRLQLKEIQQISDRVYNYVFRPDRAFSFLPGQYMEWTLPGVPYDSRGNRRTFTIASSPTERDVSVGLKYYQPASAYKATFAQMKVGDELYASQLAGNFTLDNQHEKLAFIAGGIGITPFRSMIKYLHDSGMQRDIILLYVVSDVAEFAYVEDFLAARDNGVRLIRIVTKPGEYPQPIFSAKLGRELLARHIPDYAERKFYISGPNLLVDATKRYLHELHVSRTDIKTDHFSGY